MGRKKKQAIKYPLHGTKLFYRELVEKIVADGKKDEILFHHKSSGRLNDVIKHCEYEKSMEVVAVDDNAIVEKVSSLDQTASILALNAILEKESFKDEALASEAYRELGNYPETTAKLRAKMANICAALERNDGGLIRLRLDELAILDELVELLSNSLKKNNYLEILLLQNNSITDKGVEMLCDALMQHQAIRRLCLADNFISDSGAEIIAKLICNNSNITDLNLATKFPPKLWLSRSHMFHPHISAPGAMFLANAVMKESCLLTSLSLSNQRVGDEGAIALFNAVSYSSLRTINLQGNGISNTACRAFRDALLENCLLEQVILCDNEISSDGAFEISRGLLGNVFLLSLDLGRNKIDNVGLNALLSCLEKNKTICTLCTYGNTGDDDRAELIVNLRTEERRKQEAIHKADALHHFEVANRLSQDALHSMQSAIKGGGLRKKKQKAGSKSPEEPKGPERAPTFAEQQMKLLSATLPTTTLPTIGHKRVESLRSSISPAEIQILKDVTALQLEKPNAFGAGSPTNLNSPSLNPARHKSIAVLANTQALPLSHTDAMLDAMPAGSGYFGKKVLGREMSLSNHILLMEHLNAAETPASPHRERSFAVAMGNATASSDTNSLPILTNFVIEDTPITPIKSSNSNPTSASSSRTGSPKKSRKSFVARENKGGQRSNNSTPDSASKPSRRGGFVAEVVPVIDPARVDHGIVFKPGEAIKPPPLLEIEEQDSPIPPSYYGRAKNTNIRAKAEDKKFVTMTAKSSQFKSKDLGKSTSLPNVGFMGTMPIRARNEQTGDDSHHLMYLRVSTFADFVGPGPPLTTADGRQIPGPSVALEVPDKPTSFLSIARNHRLHLEAVKNYHQTHEYKMRKKEVFTQGLGIQKQKAALRPPPASFWKDWRVKMSVVYDEGIDNAKGVYSTKNKEIDLSTAEDATSYANMVRLKKFMNEAHSPGEVVAYKRAHRLGLEIPKK